MTQPDYSWHVISKGEHEDGVQIPVYVEFGNSLAL